MPRTGGTEMKFGWKFALFVGLILVLMVGCATPSRTEFSTFAQAGGGYATAVDKLLVAAGTAQVDSTSWSLVAEKVDTGMDETTYKKKNTEDLARLDEIGRLRQHAQLLGQYFGLLEALATSDAPQRTQNSIEGIMEAIRGLNLQLPTGMSALPPIGQLAADLKIRTALREELENRKETIRLELLIQEALLKKLSEQIKHALNLDKRVQEDTLVIDPLVEKKPLEKPEQWISTRQRIVYITSTIQEIGSASQAATKLREAFEGLLAGEITIGRLNALITDIEAMLAIAETIRS
jgi:hypothetical protein